MMADSVVVDRSDNDMTDGGTSQGHTDLPEQQHTPVPSLTGLQTGETDSASEHNTPTGDRQSPALKCDVCTDMPGDTSCQYCGTCKQKLCDMCLGVHRQLGGTRNHTVEHCMTDSVTVPKPITEQLKSLQNLSTNELADHLLQELGIQVCVRYTDDSMELLGSSPEALNLAMETLTLWLEPYTTYGGDHTLPGRSTNTEGHTLHGTNPGRHTLHGINIGGHTSHGYKQLYKGKVRWMFTGEHALTIIKLFHREVCAIQQDHDVKISVYKDDQKYSWSDICYVQTPENIDSNSTSNMEPILISGMSSRTEFFSNLSINHSALYESRTDLTSNDTELCLKITCDIEDYVVVDSQVRYILDAIPTLPKSEIIRPKQDEFRMKLYTLVKESDDQVLCHMEPVESVYKLVIKARDDETTADIKQEFLSLFCKECTVCQKETPRPTYLDCKHILCHDCVKTSACYGDGLRCPLCSNEHREKTPILSLQLHCIQMLDKQPLDRRPLDKRSLNNTARTPREFSTQMHTRSLHQSKKTASGKVHHCVKIPKFIVNKWKRATGGLMRLKSHIEKNYGIKLAGSGDHLKIYGDHPDILDLAILSLENLHEKTPETGMTCRLRDNIVQWRLYGEHAQMAHFLFHKDLYALTKRFRTVTIQAFTESVPAIVDLACGFKEYGKVKYEMEELENDIRNLYVDEYIQPKNFYHNIKVKEFVQSKRKDDKVHCSLVDKNNLNVVVIKGRKKEYVTQAKDQLSHW